MRAIALGTAAILAALLLPASPAQAAMRDNSIELGAYLTHANFDNESNIEDDEGLGARLGIVFEREHELEFTADFIPTHDEFGLGLDVDLTTFKVGYIYNFAAGGPVSPLLTVGGGMQRLQVSEETVFGSEEITDETDPLAYAGLGVRFFLGPVLNIRVEGQAVAVFPDGDTDDTLVDGLFSAGVGFLLGGH